MRRARRNVLVLAGITALLGLAAWAQVHHERAQWQPPLTALDPASVTRVELRCPSCVEQRYERVDGNWQMRLPHDKPADSATVEYLLSIAQSAVRSRRALAQLDPAKLGLQPAQATLVLDDTVIAFGHLDSIDGDRYVRVGNEDVIALVPDRFSQYLFAAPL